ncbi:MAG: hypothetical protein KatS3mg027_2036 [Bacteroidia bacterium]|nr:MAG: hypothetical protein KatS3mg027_2036 [Bacteroidia bacterium]
MNKKDIEIIEYICEKWMKEFNYSSITDKRTISIKSKVKIFFYTLWYWLAIKSKIAPTVHKIYQMYFS